jgi:hypothetical protein
LIPPRKGCKKEVLDAILRIISEEALDYLNYDDIAKISYWLGNFWVGIQYEMNNRPEEIRVIEQRGSMSGNSGELKEDDNIVLVRRIVPVDEDRNKLSMVLLALVASIVFLHGESVGTIELYRW